MNYEQHKGIERTGTGARYLLAAQTAEPELRDVFNLRQPWNPWPDLIGITARIERHYETQTGYEAIYHTALAQLASDYQAAQERIAALFD